MNIASLISKYDPENQYDVLLNYHEQIKSSWYRDISLHPDLINVPFSSIIISGMGGSAISGNLFRNFCREELKLPLSIIRSYSLPAYADENTLLIVSSYSGNTEETISALTEGLRKKCKIICVTTGGKIMEIAAKNSLPCIPLFPGFQPRFSIGQSFFTLLKLFQLLNLVTDQSDIVEKLTIMWKENSGEYGSYNEELLSQAITLLGRNILIFSACDTTDSVGMRFKGQLNENSKKMAFHNEYPELNHNEIISFENVDNPGAFVVVNILDNSYHDRIKKRFDITTSLIRGKGIEVVEVQSNQATFKERLLDLILKTDWLSYYAAILAKRDPSEIDYIHYLKNELSR